MRTPSFILSVIIGPVRTEIDPVNGNEVLTHLQKYSRCGFLVTWPFCFHIWYFWRKQTTLNFEVFVPGTEQGIYARTPGFRYDRELGMKWTWGYAGGRWD
jgi:hypothetical protein